VLVVEFDVEELVAGFDGLIDPDRLDLGPALDVIGEMLVQRVHEEFETQGQGEWPELSESTLRRRGADAEMLRDTDRWYSSNQPETDDDSVTVGTDVEYAVYHVSDQPRSVIPLRNPYVLRDDAIDEIAEVVADWLTGGTLAGPSGRARTS